MTMPHKDKESNRKYRREYYATHREEIRAYQKEYQRTHKKERSILQVAYQKRNKEKYLAYQAKYRGDHRAALDDYQSDWYYKREYGISLEDVDRMAQEQGNACAICGRPFESRERRMRHVDHDHATGAIRGLLCQHCNHGLGSFHDNPTSLRAAAAYLERAAKLRSVA
jgi:hypothetical protein